jgi:hypothetical protein
MFISGFTIIKNAIKNDFPVVESIQSVLPLVDEMIILIGDSDDDTIGLIKSIDSDKIKIHHSVWDASLREGGKVLAVETNKALALVNPAAIWALYIQADELLHEKDYLTIKDACAKYAGNASVEGLLFDYLHFYGNYNYIGNSRTWYKHEVRIIKMSRGITSYRDAQGFRKEGEKIKVKAINANVYHYGWVKTPKQMLQKNNDIARYWNKETDAHLKPLSEDEFFNYDDFESLKIFDGSHPSCMQTRIKHQQLTARFDVNKKKLTAKESFLLWIEGLTGRRPFTFTNYKRI